MRAFCMYVMFNRSTFASNSIDPNAQILQLHEYTPAENKNKSMCFLSHARSHSSFFFPLMPIRLSTCCIRMSFFFCVLILCFGIHLTKLKRYMYIRTQDIYCHVSIQNKPIYGELAMDAMKFNRNFGCVPTIGRFFFQFCVHFVSVIGRQLEENWQLDTFPMYF